MNFWKHLMICRITHDFVHMGHSEHCICISSQLFGYETNGPKKITPEPCNFKNKVYNPTKNAITITMNKNIEKYLLHQVMPNVIL